MALRKLNPRWASILTPAIQAFVMTFFVTGIATFRAIGLPPDFVGRWMGAWPIAFVIAAPIAILVLPLAQKLVRAFVEEA